MTLMSTSISTQVVAEKKKKNFYYLYPSEPIGKLCTWLWLQFHFRNHHGLTFSSFLSFLVQVVGCGIRSLRNCAGDIGSWKGSTAKTGIFQAEWAGALGNPRSSLEKCYSSQRPYKSISTKAHVCQICLVDYLLPEGVFPSRGSTKSSFWKRRTAVFYFTMYRYNL